MPAEESKTIPPHRSEKIGKAISAWREQLGADNVLNDLESLQSYSRSVCGGKRNIPCILRPANRSGVENIVAIANEYGIPVYAISVGANWGMGSRLPARDNCVLVDLSRMNRILEVDVDQHYAIIEPGVTQRELYDYLCEHDLPLLFNVTGSSGDTSIIGNALDRGVGYFASRADSLSGLEVVLGNGNTVHTGFSHYPNAKTSPIYRHGIGPSLDGLFSQSNYGIVTRACFELMPKQESHMAVIAKIDSDDKLPEFIDALADLRRQEIIRTVAHVGNKARSEITLAPLVWEQLRKSGADGNQDLKALAEDMLAQEGFGPWSAVVGVMGTRSEIKLARREISRSLKGIARTVFLTDGLVDLALKASEKLSFLSYVRKKRIMLESILPLYEITKGIPTDAPLKSVYWPADDFESMAEKNPDHSQSGMLYCLPILPIDGATVSRVMGRTREVFAEYGFEAYITVNLMDKRAMECVVSLGCKRSNHERMRAARECIQQMEKEYMDAGYILYRAGVDSLHRVLDSDDSFWKTAKDLKQVLDPNNIIAPGRYNLI